MFEGSYLSSYSENLEKGGFGAGGVGLSRHGRANYETDGAICVFGVAWFCGVDSHFLNGVQ